MGFLQICTGVVLLQLSKSAKDVPDSAVFAGDLDQVRTVAEQEQPESEPKADAIRGTAALIRRLSTSRQKMEAEEAKRVYEDRMRDAMEPIAENEQVQWDGVRRRKTVRLEPEELNRRKTMHPPLGLTKFPSYDEDEAEVEAERPHTGRSTTSNGLGERFFSFRRRTSASNMSSPLPRRPTGAEPIPEDDKEAYGRALETIPSGQGGMEMQHVYGMPPGLGKRVHGNSGTSSRVSPGDAHHGKPIMWAGDVEDHGRSKSSLTPHSSKPPTARRQFSFQNLFQRSPSADGPSEIPIRPWLGNRPGSSHNTPVADNATEEELHGLVKGDSQVPSETSSDSENPSLLHPNRKRDAAGSATALTSEARRKELEVNSESAKRLSGSSPELRTPGGGRPLPKTPTEDESEGEGDEGKKLGLKLLDVPRKPRGGGGPPAYI